MNIDSVKINTSQVMMIRECRAFSAKEKKLMQGYAAKDEVNAPLCAATNTAWLIHLQVFSNCLSTGLDEADFMGE